MWLQAALVSIGANTLEGSGFTQAVSFKKSGRYRLILLTFQK